MLATAAAGGLAEGGVETAAGAGAGLGGATENGVGWAMAAGAMASTGRGVGVTRGRCGLGGTGVVGTGVGAAGVRACGAASCKVMAAGGGNSRGARAMI